MKLLFFQWNAFMQKGMENALRQLNIPYDTYEYVFKDWDKDDTFVENFHEKVKMCGYDVILSVNFSPLIADVCQMCQVQYVSWIYDCPLHIRRTEALKYACNELYFFDKMQVEFYRAMGVEHAYHLPLAVDPEVFAQQKNEEYQCDVSLLGKLYRSDFSYLCGPIDNYARGYLEGCVQAQMNLSGAYLLNEMVTKDLVNRLNEFYLKASNGTFSIQPEELEFTLACETTGRERYTALALLQSRSDVMLYSNDQTDLKKIRNMGYVDYYTEMPRAFATSRMNLNISLCAIQTGIPLRVLDIIGCGGFVMTNFQQELLDYFVPDQDIVIYENMKDLVAKTQYYLAHEQEREHMKQRSQNIIKEAFRFEERIRKMLLI